MAKVHFLHQSRNLNTNSLPETSYINEPTVTDLNEEEREEIDDLREMDEQFEFGLVEDFKVKLSDYIEKLSHVHDWETKPSRIENLQTATPILLLKEFLKLFHTYSNSNAPRLTLEKEMHQLLVTFEASIESNLTTGTFRPIINHFVDVLKTVSGSPHLQVVIFEILMSIVDDISLQISYHQIEMVPIDRFERLTREVYDYSIKFLNELEQIEDVNIKRKSVFDFIDYILLRAKDLNNSEKGRQLLDMCYRHLSRVMLQSLNSNRITQEEYTEKKEKIELIGKIYNNDASSPAGL